MSLQPLKPVLVLLLVVSIVALVWAVGLNAKGLALAISALFPLFVGGVALTTNWRALKGDNGSNQKKTAHAAQQNAELMGFVFAWGGLAMFAVYSLTQLWWFHSWQYGLLMLIFAAGLFGYAHLLGSDDSSLRRPQMLSGGAWLALAQGLAVLVGLAFLISTGKPFIDGRTDWPANFIFVTGGLGIAAVSLMAAAAYRRLSRLDGPTAVNGA